MKKSPTPLLYHMLRHSLLWEYANGIVQRTEEQPWVVNRRPLELELLDFHKKNHSRTSLRDLKQVGSDDFVRNRIDEVKSSLQNLSEQSTAELERLFSESVDLSSYRLDAWITSFATRKLKHLRQRSPEGLYVGGYGYLENLKPRESRKSEGYIHAPSMNHASTSAVLYNGYLTYKDEEGESPLAIDLSSSRTERALQILDGVRQGQPLGALLGYQFERGLQEDNLQRFIYPFRLAFPLLIETNEIEDGDSPTESISARNVVHGLKLNKKWQTFMENEEGSEKQKAKGALGKLIDILEKQEAQFSGSTPEENEKLIRHLLHVDDTVDALSDLLLSESVHQSVQGNHMRSVATLEALSAGEVTPPEMEITKTPRSGISNTYRVLSMFPDTNSDGQSWNINSPKAKAQPTLESWAAHLLGSPEDYSFTIHFVDENDQVLATESMTLAELKICALDLVFMGEMGTGKEADLNMRILNAAQEKYSGNQALQGAQITIDFEEVSNGKKSFAELREVLVAVQKLIAHARPLQPSDVVLPEHAGEHDVSYNEDDTLNDVAGVLNDCIENIVDAFFINLSDLEEEFWEVLEIEALEDDFVLHELPGSANLEALGKVFFEDTFPGSSIDLDRLKSDLHTISFFGFEDCVLTSGVMGEPFPKEEILLKVYSLLKQTAKVRKELNSIDDQLQSANDADKIQELKNKKVKRLFGEHCFYVPSFTLNDIEAAKLTGVFDPNKRKSLLRNDPYALNTWRVRMGRVRKGFQRLNDLIFVKETEENHVSNFTVSQISGDSPSGEDLWIGLEKNNQQYPNGTVSIAVHQSVSGELDFSSSISGLLVDEWVEVVPNQNETTGVAFHYDAPVSRPAQSILLAVTPDIVQNGQKWSDKHLLQTVIETMELAKIRSVDGASLRHMGHFLPALYFANNLENDTTIKIDFKKDKKSQ
jgi:hypothetical protein